MGIYVRSNKSIKGGSIMNFIDKITGNDLTRDYRKLETRIAVLPDDYQELWNAILQQLWGYGDMTGRNLIPLLEGVVSLLEEANLDNIPISEILGEEINLFIDDLTSAHGIDNYRLKMHKRLNNKIHKQLKKGER